MRIRSITLFVMVALCLPCSLRAASHYAQSVTDTAGGVSSPDEALGREDGVAAELAPQAYIELDMENRFGDVCAWWDIYIHIGQSQPNNIKVWLKDYAGSWELADLDRTSPVAHVDMADLACQNIGLRWRYIKVQNIDDVAITIDAVENIFDPEPPSSDLSADYAFAATPYPEDRCDCGEPAVATPVLGRVGITSLAAVLALSGGIAVRLLRRRRTS